MINPLRSEREAFRAFLYVLAFAIAVIVLVLVVRAL